MISLFCSAVAGLLLGGLSVGPILASHKCQTSRLQIAEDLQSSEKEKRFRGFANVLRCEHYDELPLVKESMDSPEGLVVAAAAMTLAMSGQREYREMLVDRYMHCPGGSGCTTDPVYLRAAVIVGCSELDVGTDPKFYELPRPPIEKMDELCVKRVEYHLFEDEPPEDAQAPHATNPGSGSADGADEVENLLDLVSTSGSSKWVPLLAPLLSMEYPEVRRRAALAMTHCDPKWVAKYFPTLLDDENAFVRNIVVGALAKQLTPEVCAAFRRRLQVETDQAVSFMLRNALGELER